MKMKKKNAIRKKASLLQSLGLEKVISGTSSVCMHGVVQEKYGERRGSQIVQPSQDIRLTHRSTGANSSD